ncbi:hypothetical protein ACS0TY_001732 [Phlomoides rotata]
MGEVVLPKNEVDEEKQAHVEIWKYAFGFTPMAVVKCAIQLQIADVLESHGGAMTHADLSAAVGLSPPVLRRIMRYLIHRRFFKHETLPVPDSSISYTQTPLSRMLIKNSENSIVDLLLLESSEAMIAPWHKLTSTGAPPFVAEHGCSIWEYGSANPEFNKQFNAGMACLARLSMDALTEKCPEAFTGIRSLVDVGGGNGTTLRSLVKAFPWIRGINLDLPHVVADAPQSDGIEHVAGDMFQAVPKADAVFIMRVLHGWGDEECVQILKKCREAIPAETGKVMIAEGVIREGEEEGGYSDMSLALDMVLYAHAMTGKVRTYEEWDYVLKQAGFTRFTVKDVDSIISVIEAYP